MNRIAASVLSVLVAYAVCAASGVNLWAYVWLKAFYVPCQLCMWLGFALLFGSCAARDDVAGRPVIGAATAYVAGVIAYQVGPALKDGSFFRSTSTISTHGWMAYLGTSVLFPFLCLWPLAGIVAAVMLKTLTERKVKSVAVAVVAAVFVVGWVFFLTRGALPARW